MHARTLSSIVLAEASYGMGTTVALNGSMALVIR